MFESGECLIRFRYHRPEDNLSVPLQLQVLEPDYIDNNKNELLRTGGYIQNGIYRDWETDRKSTRLNSSHSAKSRMPSSA